MNVDETKEFIAMWHNDLDQLDSLGITAWLRSYTDIGCLEDGSPARQLQSRVDAKLRTAADTIDQLTEERDEARRMHCHMSAQFMYKNAELVTAKHVANNKGWDCFKEETQ